MNLISRKLSIQLLPLVSLVTKYVHISEEEKQPLFFMRPWKSLAKGHAWASLESSLLKNSNKSHEC